MLKTEGHLPNKNKLLHFNPFLDSDGILRVGGRIQNSKLPWNQIHPITFNLKITSFNINFKVRTCT